MEVLIKVVCCVAPSLPSAMTCRYGTLLSDWLMASSTGGRGGGGLYSERWRFAALRAFQMALIYEPLRTVGLMNATRHVFGTEGTVSGHHSVFEEGVSDTAA